MTDNDGIYVASAIDIRQLSAWNPLDYLRVLGWLIFEPTRLSVHRAQGGEKSIRQIGAWLASTLLWVPLIMPPTALASGLLVLFPPLLSEPDKVWGYWLSIGMVVGWLMTGIFGNRNKECLSLPLATLNVVGGSIYSLPVLITSFFIAFSLLGVLSNASSNHIPLGIFLGIVSLAAFMLCITLAYVVSSLAAGDIGQYLALLMVSWVAGWGISSTAVYAFVILIFAIDNILGWIMHVLLPSLIVVSIYIVVPLAFTLARQSVLPKKPEQGRLRLVLRLVVFVFLLASYALLMWICFLGGWSTLTRLAGVWY